MADIEPQLSEKEKVKLKKVLDDVAAMDELLGKDKKEIAEDGSITTQLWLDSKHRDEMGSNLESYLHGLNKLNGALEGYQAASKNLGGLLEHDPVLKEDFVLKALQSANLVTLSKEADRVNSETKAINEQIVGEKGNKGKKFYELAEEFRKDVKLENIFLTEEIKDVDSPDPLKANLHPISTQTVRTVPVKGK